MNKNEKPKILLLYHFFYPDNVISARHFTDLAIGLSQRGCEVTVIPCNRSCRGDSNFKLIEYWNNIRIYRIWRPNWTQKTYLGRVLNSIWITAAWAMSSFYSKYDAVVFGTDPPMGYVSSIAWKLFSRKTKLYVWTFDLYPEALVANKDISNNSFLYYLSKLLARFCYKIYDAVIDIGECMKQHLFCYTMDTKYFTITPWALFEPDEPLPSDCDARKRLFGKCNLALLYSGNLGRAHQYEDFILLAEKLRDSNVKVCFAGHGHKMDELFIKSTQKQINVKFASFVDDNHLAQHLSSADIHLVSLNNDWSGIVVPSKFFGSLAIGRPVIYSGPTSSSIAKYILENDLGWILRSDNVQLITNQLISLTENPQKLDNIKRHCHNFYKTNFAKKKMLDNFCIIIKN